MNSNIIQRLLKGLGANVYGQGVVLIIQLAGVPILLRHWGPQLYGEWLILFAIPAYLSLTDLGFSQSAGNDMTARVARGDTAGTVTAFQSLGVLVLCVAITGLIIAAIVVSSLPVGWLRLSALTTGDVRWVLWLLAAEVLLKLFDGVIHAGFRAAGDYALHTTIHSSTLFAQHASVWMLASLGRGPVVAAAAYLTIRVAVTPVVSLLLTHRHRWLRFGFGQASIAHLRALLRPAVANTVLPLAQALNLQGMTLVVGATLGPVAVVTFSTIRTLTRFAVQLAYTVSHATEPELAAAWGRANAMLLRGLYNHAIRAAFWLTSAACIGLLLAGPWILHAWTQGTVRMDPALFHLLLASSVAGSLWYSGLNLLKAANRHLPATAFYSACAGAAVLLAGLLLLEAGNLAYTGVSLLLVDLAMVVYTLRAAAQLWGGSALDMLTDALNPAPLVRLLASRSHVR